MSEYRGILRQKQDDQKLNLKTKLGLLIVSSIPFFPIKHNDGE